MPDADSPPPSIERSGLDGSTLQVERIRHAYEQVADQLLNQIYAGMLTSGDRLPGELVLAQRFGVSRNTVREALKVLSSRGLIYSARGRSGGTFISEVNLAQVSDHLEASLGLMLSGGSITARELFEMREALEIASARLAARRRTDEQVTQLASIIEESEGLTKRADNSRLHRGFHQLVAEAGDNHFVASMLEVVVRVLGIGTAHIEASPAVWAQVQQEHRDLVGALATQDEDAAAKAVHQHMTTARHLYFGE